MTSKTASNKDLVDHVAKETGWSVSESRAAVKTTFDGVAKLLKKHDRVSITGMGSFGKTIKAAQKGGKKATNPFTGESYVTKPKPKTTKVKFRPGKGFKDF